MRERKVLELQGGFIKGFPMTACARVFDEPVALCVDDKYRVVYSVYSSTVAEEACCTDGLRHSRSIISVLFSLALSVFEKSGIRKLTVFWSYHRCCILGRAVSNADPVEVKYLF